ncbi:MAG: glycoside hydrolase family 2 protein [Bryobacteraceae bacterium]
MISRREFLSAALVLSFDRPGSLDGEWRFHTDPHNRGELEGWHLASHPDSAWTTVTVPHTWQVEPQTASYMGAGWYRRTFDAPASWSGQTIRVEFEAVYHTAHVWVNGKPVGSHIGKGYTAFQCDITSAVRPGANVLAVRADNSFREDMLPRGSSYDWTQDGGIIRPVSILVTPPVYIERVDVDAAPDLAVGNARLDVRVVVRNAGRAAAQVQPGYEVREEDTGRVVLGQRRASAVSLAPGAAQEIAVPATLAAPQLWHFDHPHLYRLTASINGHEYETTFGVRSIEVREGGLFLNGERVRLMGAERMAGSHPDYGMAEPSEWIEHDHRDMKELNTVFTRVHWPQDRRVLDFCDRHGILIQEEVPTWGPNTFKGMTGVPDPEIMRNGLEQLREMVRRDRNHPSIYAWGLCNEVNGQNAPAQEFIRQMYDEARRLDPRRLRTYASNSLQRTPERDASGQMDFISWNEYYESWFRGSVEDMESNLEAIHRAFPGKMVVISEYGFCECNPRHIGGDRRRIDVLEQHTRVFRSRPWIGGVIFFDYNDYRTHIGDKGIAPLQQRVHGVVDLYGEKKPSWDALRRESSPVESLRVRIERGAAHVTVRARAGMPAYTLEGYRVRAVAYGQGNLPMEQCEVPLPRLAPGGQAALRIPIREKAPARVRVDVVRPTGFTAATAG